MARQVHAAIVQILVEERRISSPEADKLLSSMKRQKQYQVRIYSKYGL